MPMGSFPELRDEDLSIGRLLDLRQIYGVSTEAVLIRTVRLSNQPVAMFCASRVEMGAHEGAYRLDYLIASRTFPHILRRGALLPATTVVAECNAIGYSARATEAWGGDQLKVECVGVSPYPSSAWPRVVGLVRIAGQPSGSETSGINYVLGNALVTKNKAPTIIAHVVNDATPNWGGRGFAQALREELPIVQEDFRQWTRLHRTSFKLGESRLCEVSADLWVLSMICQEGYGPSLTPRLRYGPLQTCLARLADKALELGAVVHMPRIGTGQAGGSWEIVEELIGQEVTARGAFVTVYDLPRRSASTPPSVQ